MIKKLYLLLECGHIRLSWSRQINSHFYRCPICGISYVALDGRERNKLNDEHLFWEKSQFTHIDDINKIRDLTDHDIFTDGAILKRK